MRAWRGAGPGLLGGVALCQPAQVSGANEIGEPNVEPTRQTPGHIRRQRAMVSAARSPIRPRPATCSDGADAPEERKVGGSTPPLTTTSDQRRCPVCPMQIGRLTATVTATASAQRLTQLAERLALLLQRHVCVDRHRDLDGRVTDDLPDDMRWSSEIQQERDAGMAEIMETHRAEPGAPAPSSACRCRRSSTHIRHGMRCNSAPVLLAFDCPAPGRRVQGACGVAARSACADPGPGAHSPGVRAYEEDEMEQSNGIFLIWQSMTAARSTAFCPVKSRTFGVMMATGHSGAAAKNWSRAPAQGC
jgi:hypothetical protein